MCGVLLFLGIINGGAWYFFFYYFLYSIKQKVNLWMASFILLTLFSFALITCPLVLRATGLMEMACMHMQNMGIRS